MLLKDKSVLVIGAGGLLGREVVLAVAKQGGIPIAADVRLESLDSLSEICEDENLECVQIDITSKDSIIRAINYCERRFGGLDGAVNAAYPRNKNYGKMVFDVAFEDFSDSVSLHLGGYFLVMQQCAAYAKNRGSPFSLVSLSSIYGVVAPRFEIYEKTKMVMPVEYAVIKSALLHMNKYFTNYMKGTGFRVNSVSPGGLLDGQEERFLQNYKEHCIGKGMLDPSDVTGSVIFLLSYESRFMAGQNLIVDDGFSN